MTASSPNTKSRQEPGNAPRLILILGGARSGKSAFAERLAAASQRSVAYIATATAGDDEMRQRIARHRERRPAQWQTIEEPLDLAGAVQQAGAQTDIVLLDCITLWLSNVLLEHELKAGQGGERNGSEAQERRVMEAGTQIEDLLVSERALAVVESLLAAVRILPAEKTVIVVSNEVGLGIVPSYHLGRLYRDTLGYVNQALAQVAERVYLMVAGLALDLKQLDQEATL